MLREIITNAIKETTKKNGYTLYSGFQHRIDNQNIKFPAAWVNPIHIVNVEGREEGYITYRATMHLMQIEKKITEEIKEKIWNEMERDALNIINETILKNTIFNINNINMEPAEFNISKNGEISLKMNFDIKIYFCLSNNNPKMKNENNQNT